MEDLNDKQQLIFRLFVEPYMNHKQLPSLEQVADIARVSESELEEYLYTLHELKYIEYKPPGYFPTPTIRILKRGVPVYGLIQAGKVERQIQESEGYLAVYGLSENMFALRVEGDSMTPRIQEGAIVLLEKKPPNLHIREICSVYIESREETTLKWVEWELNNKLVHLISENDVYETKTFSIDEIEIQGVYHSSISPELTSEFLRPFSEY